MADLHVPKLETFDVPASANVDPKGFVRDVDVFEAHPHGLYMARGADHPQFGYLESWLLPSLGLRANVFHFRPGVEATSHRYLDVAEVTRGDDGVWRTRDLYLDLLVLGGDGLGGGIRVDDADELTAAIAAGIVGADVGAWAVDRAFDALAGITAHDGDADAWLASVGCPVTWAESITLAEPDQPHPKRVAIGAGPGSDPL
ncbi:DUF402 domain-containing protein [Corynebacterium sp. NPDC060344]|uniref:DUF402 domain-containing protein n=1 Tax=Corynebacterium sp. NPDC060344 TaxID=3347101 RepID=UPI003650D64F